MTFGTGESLDEIVKRAALPIFVAFTPIGDWDQWLIADISRDAPVTITPDDDVAKRRYLALVASLETIPGNSTSLPGTAADCSTPSPGCV